VVWFRGLVDGDEMVRADFTRRNHVWVTGNLTERKIGTFEADLIEPSDDEEKL
jgi:hypothetical protein